MKQLPSPEHRLNFCFRNARITRWLPAALIVAIVLAPTLNAQPRRKSGPCIAPYVAAAHMQDTVYWYDVAPFSIPVIIGPKEARMEVTGGSRLVEIDPARHLYAAIINMPPPQAIRITIEADNCGQAISDTFYLSAEKPTLRTAQFADSGAGPIANGIDQWAGLDAEIGRVYDPSSEWMSDAIPGNHYQTVVTIKGHEVLNRAGVTFKNLPRDVQSALTITDDMKPGDIVTQVYWKPGGTPFMDRWVLLLANQPDAKAVLPLEHARMAIRKPGPEPVREEDTTREFTVSFDHAHGPWRSTGLILVEPGGNGERGLAQAGVQCYDCDQYGLGVHLEREDDIRWRIVVVARDIAKLLAARTELRAKLIPVNLILDGKYRSAQNLIYLNVVVDD